MAKSKYCGKDFLIQRAFSATAWVTLTAYAKGDYVTSGSNVYRAIAAGTSGATTPSGTGSSITDGTVTWAYVGVTATLAGYLSVAGMRSNSLKINNEQVDVTDKGDGQWRQLLQCGIRSMEASGSGMFSNDFSADDMVSDAMNGAIVDFKLISGRGDMFVGAFLVATCERNGEYNGAEQYALSLASAGAIVHTPA